MEFVTFMGIKFSSTIVGSKAYETEKQYLTKKQWETAEMQLDNAAFKTFSYIGRSATLDLQLTQLSAT